MIPTALSRGVPPVDELHGGLEGTVAVSHPLILRETEEIKKHALELGTIASPTPIFSTIGDSRSGPARSAAAGFTRASTSTADAGCSPASARTWNGPPNTSSAILSVEKMRATEPGPASLSGSILYRSGMNKKIGRSFEVFTPCDSIAAITKHIPDKSFQLVRYYG